MARTHLDTGPLQESSGPAGMAFWHHGQLCIVTVDGLAVLFHSLMPGYSDDEEDEVEVVEHETRLGWAGHGSDWV